MEYRCARVFKGCFDNLADSVGLIIIIRIEKTDEFPSSQGDSFVHCIIDTTIQFADPVVYLLSESSYDIQRSIGRSTINDDVLDISIILAENFAGASKITSVSARSPVETNASQRVAATFSPPPPLREGTTKITRFLSGFILLPG